MYELSESVLEFARATSSIIEAVGIGVILVGSAIATVVFFGQLRSGFDESYQCYRKHLGRAILLGLEFLVAADIIKTVAVEPTFESVAVLGLLVLIRTFLSFALELEVNGHWPWQRTRHGSERAV